MFLAVCRRCTSRKTRVVAPEMFGLTCRVGAHNSCYAHDTRLYPTLDRKMKNNIAKRTLISICDFKLVRLFLCTCTALFHATATNDSFLTCVDTFQTFETRQPSTPDTVQVYPTVFPAKRTALGWHAWVLKLHKITCHQVPRMKHVLK